MSLFFSARIDDSEEDDEWDVINPRTGERVPLRADCWYQSAPKIAKDQLFIRPPGISDGAFQLRMDNIWFCKLLLLFKIHTMTDTGMQYHDCTYVSVLEEYNGHWKSGHILHILHIIYVLIYYLSTSAWLDQCQSAIVVRQDKSCM